MSKDDDQGLSAVAVGYAWCARITTFSLEFAAIVAFGYFIDDRFGSEPFGLLVGVAVGMFAFTTGLMDAVRRMTAEDIPSEEPLEGPNGDAKTK